MLLAIDTATRVISLALHDGHGVIAEASWATANHHTVELAPAIDNMLAQAKITTADLTAVAVALGPGSFTGLRIGLGLAKGLVTALSLPLIGIPTLEILAASQPAFTGDLIATLQAGRGRICAQPFRWVDDTWTPAGEAGIVSWDDLLDGLADETPALISGEIPAEALPQIEAANDAGKTLVLAPAADRLRRASYLADLAWARLRTGHVDDPLLLVPIYLHQPGVPHP